MGEDESAVNDISSPYAFSQKQQQTSHSKEDNNMKQYKTGYLLISQPTMNKKSDAAQHIRWLHMAYIKEKDERLSQKNLKIKNSTKKPPKFDHVINRGQLKQMYEYLKNVFRSTIYSLTESYMKSNGDKYD